jgi:predicted PurR-regulated permease PerM
MLLEPKEKLYFSLTIGTIVKVIAAVFLCVFVFLVKDILLAVLASVVIASSIEPAIRFLNKYKIPRTGAVLIVYAVLSIIFILTMYFIFPVILREIVSLLKTLPSTVGDIQIKSDVLYSLESSLKDVSPSNNFSEYIFSITNALNIFGSGPFEAGSYVFNGIVGFIIIFILSFYLSAQQDGVGDFLRIITPSSHEAYVIGLWRRTQKNIGRWMQGQLILGLLVGVFVFIGLSILDIRHALLLAIVAGLFEIIPVFGSILGAIPAVAIGFTDGGIGLALLVAGLYVIIQQLESNVIYPLVVKKIIGVSPIIVIVSVMIGFSLGGILGVLLSVPIATALLEYLHDIERSRKHHG